MKRILTLAVASLLGAPLSAQQDPGKQQIGTVEVIVYHATNKPQPEANQSSAPAAVAQRLRKEECLRFDHYQILGKDRQPLYRSYENWAEPLKPSDEVMVRFEAQSDPTDGTAILDIELWLGRKKTIKTDARIHSGKPLFVLGPEWRQGRLIISISMVKPQ